MDEEQFKIGDKIRFNLDKITRCPSEGKRCSTCGVFCKLYTVTNVLGYGLQIRIRGPEPNCKTWTFEAPFPSNIFHKAYCWRKL